MSVLGDARDQLTQLLNDVELHAFATIPDVATPPLVFVSPGQPYLTYEVATFATAIARFSVVPVVAAGTNDVAAGALDDLLLAVMRAIGDAHGFVVEEVDQPGSISINGQTHLAVNLTVQTEIDMRSTP